MDNLENQTTSPQPSADLEAQIQSLRQLVVSALVLIFILSGAVNIYFWRQLRMVNTELAPLQAKSAQIAAEMGRVNTAANEFARKLIEYGKTHPSFVPILDKYNLRSMPTNAPAAKAATPATKAKAPATK